MAFPGAADESFRGARLVVDERCRGEGGGRVVSASSDGAAQDAVDGRPVRRLALRYADRDEIPSADSQAKSITIHGLFYVVNIQMALL